MKKNTGSITEINHFVGVCVSCGEHYQAQSPTDDLEGINFKCKKMVCTGRVTLVATAEPSTTAKNASIASAGGHKLSTPASANTPPRRYC